MIADIGTHLACCIVFSTMFVCAAAAHVAYFWPRRDKP